MKLIKYFQNILPINMHDCILNILEEIIIKRIFIIYLLNNVLLLIMFYYFKEYLVKKGLMRGILYF